MGDRFKPESVIGMGQNMQLPNIHVFVHFILPPQASIICRPVLSGSIKTHYKSGENWTLHTS